MNRNMTTAHNTIGVIIAAYESAGTLKNVLLKVLETIPANSIWVVDDGSKDQTSRIARTLGVRTIRHEKNCGKGAALKSGYSAVLKTGLEAVITLDSDGQHDPALIPDFIARYRQSQADMIIGKRKFQITSMPLDRILSNVISSFIVSCYIRKWIPDSQCGYRLISTGLLQSVALKTSHFDTEVEIIIRAMRKGFRVESQPISVIYQGEHSHIHRFADIVRFVKLLVTLCCYRKGA